jgi:molybdopterin converting factor small subunit
MDKYPDIKKSAFRYSAVFYKGKPINYYGFHTPIKDGDEIIFTQFVGGG